MKNKTKLFLASMGLAFASAVYASVTCPIDNMSMYFTGNTTTEMGKLLKEYKCPNGHTNWVVN
jgi:hypothetical protein